MKKYFMSVVGWNCRSVNSITQQQSPWQVNAKIALAVIMILFCCFMMLPCSAVAVEPCVLTVKEGDNILKEFSLTELKQIAASDSVRTGVTAYSYSSFNTYPTGQQVLNAQGPLVESIINAAYADAYANKLIVNNKTLADLSDNTVIETVSTDGVTSRHSVKQLFRTERYYFPHIPVKGIEMQWYEGGGLKYSADKVAVPAILDLNNFSGRLSFGQITAMEQTFPYFNKWVGNGGSLVIRPDAMIQTTATVEVTPSTADKIEAGKASKVTFTKNSRQNAKLYYTISKDGTVPADPTMYNSFLYNIDTYDGDGIPVPHQFPVLDTVGTTIIKARYYEPGYLDGDIISFTYNVVDGSEIPPVIEDCSVTINSPVIAQEYAQKTELTISGSTQNMDSVLIMIKDTLNQLVFVSQPQTYKDTFSVKFMLPAVVNAAGRSDFLLTVSGVAGTVKQAVAFAVVGDKTGSEIPGGGGNPGGETGVTVLTVKGDGVAGEKKFSLPALQNLPNALFKYSTINTWPTKNIAGSYGVTLRDILEAAGLKDTATMITMNGSDGYSQVFTLEELLVDNRYYYPNLVDGSANDSRLVPASLSLQYGDGSFTVGDETDMRFCLGQRNLQEQNMPWFVQNVNEIIVSCAEVERWDMPGVDVAPGKVAQGTKVKLTFPVLGAVKIFYTVDEATPDKTSAMYNISRYQPEIILPITIEHSMVIKAIVSGNGKSDSRVAEFAYIVDDPLHPPVPGGNTGQIGGLEPLKADLQLELQGISSAGVYKVMLGAADLDDVIKKAAALSSKEAMLQITLSKDSSNTQAMQVEIFQTALEKLIASNIGKLQITTAFGSFVIDKDVMQKLAEMHKSSYIIEIALLTQNVMQSENKKNFSFNIYAGQSKLMELSAPIMFKLPYNKKITEANSGLIICILGQDGKLFPLKSSLYDSENQTLSFLINKTGQFILSYAPAQFADTEAHWAKDIIAFAYSRKIVAGYGDGKFYPDDRVTRGQFVKMLYSCLDEAISNNVAELGFKDLDKNNIYYNYIARAFLDKVIAGYPNGTFCADAYITREQMAVILNNFTAAIGVTVENKVEAAAFRDQNKISDYALQAVLTMQKGGILLGKGEGLFDPAGYATRAEALKLCCSIILLILQHA